MKTELSGFNHLVVLLCIILCTTVSSDPVQVDSRTHVNRVLNETNTKSTVIPSGMLIHTDKGQILFNAAGGGDNQDDGFGKKPRPWFDGENLRLGHVNDLSKIISELLDYIELLLDKPQQELAPEQIESALDELEIVNNERLRQEAEKRQAAIETGREVLSMADHSQLAFSHHPGYQEDHPAHSLDNPSTVAGIVETPKRKGGKNKRHSRAASAKGKEKAAEKPGTSRANNGGNSKKKRASGGDGSEPPEQPEDTEGAELPENSQTEVQVVTKEINVDGKTYTIEAELTDGNRDLHCGFCLGLVSELARHCLMCGNNVCQHEATPCCIYCRQTNENQFQLANLKLRINNLKWLCPARCGSEHDLVNIEAHIRQCEECTASYSGTQPHKPDLIECRHEGCQEMLDSSELQAHESTCQWRLVNLGSIEVPAWQSDLIAQNSIAIPKHLTPDDVTTQNSAQICVTFLARYIGSILARYIGSILARYIGSIHTTPAATGATPGYPCRWDCSYQGSSNEDLDYHYAHHCPLARVDCRYCQTPQLRSDLQNHQRRCGWQPVECPYECGKQNLRAEDLVADRHFQVCSMLPIPCDLCNQWVPRQHSGSHQAEECNQRQIQCRACFAGMRFCELETHEQQCEMLCPFALGTQFLNPQQGAQGPVFEPREGSDTEVYLILPAQVLIDLVSGQSKESPNISLIWNQTRYSARFIHSTISMTLLRLRVEEEEVYDITKASINVFSDTGEFLATMKTFLGQFKKIAIGSKSNQGIAAFYDPQPILSYQGSYFFIQIKKYSNLNSCE